MGVDHLGPLLGLHAVKLRVARDAGIIDQNVDRSECGLDLFDAGRARLEGRNVPLEDTDAGFGLDFLRRLVAAAVICSDVEAGRLQTLADRSANAARTAGDECNAGHDFLPSWLADARSPTSDIGVRIWCHRHCEEPTGPARSGRPDDKLRDKAIQVGAAALDCFASLAMTKLTPASSPDSRSAP